MAQPGVLPYVPSPLEQLAPYLAQAAGGIAQGLARHAVNKKDELAQEEFQNATTPMGRVNAFMKLSPERQKYFGTAYSAFEKSQQQQQHQDQSGLTNDDYSAILDRLDSQLDQRKAGRSVWLQSFLGGGTEAQESIAAFQSESTALLGLAQKVALKQGIRTQKEFDAFLNRTIPNASDTIATSKGKIRGLRSYIIGNNSKTEYKKEGKTKFDFSNPKHIARRTKALQQSGSQEEANKILAEEFEI